MPPMFTPPKTTDRAHSRSMLQSPALPSTPTSLCDDHERRMRQSGVFQRFSRSLVGLFMVKCHGVWCWVARWVAVPGLIGLTFGVAAAMSLMIALLYYLVFACKPVSMDAVLPHDFISKNVITTDGKPIDGISRWLKEFTHSVVPRNCHSHNDYWRPYPLFSALAAGCVGVEADIWLSDDGLDLLVGHDRGSLSSERTLQKMYLDPLVSILEHQNSQ
ncbi:hypothetical protein CcaCcLH18_13548 [Colletotrichum camelliae]|nr:hypothetical protein CcaCcLH18_13548 [Colletotrichum camelliae]